MANNKFLGGNIFPGSIDVSITVLLRKTADNTEQTGVADTSVTAYYWRQGGTPTQITVTNGSSITAAHSDGAWEEAHASMPGAYRFDLPDAAVATGADWVVISVKVSGCYVFFERYSLNAVLPNADHNAVGGLPELDANSNVPADVKRWSGATVAAPSTAGVPEVNVAKILNVAPTLSNNKLDVNVNRIADVAAVAGAIPAIAAGANGGLPLGDAAGKVALQADQAVNATKWAGTAIPAPVIAGVPKVDMTHCAATAQTARDIGANVDVVLSTRASAAALATAQTSLNGIDAKTANLPTDPADESLVIAATDAIMSRIGANGANLTALGDTRLAALSNLDVLVSSRHAAGAAVASVSGNVGGNVVGDVNGKVLGGGASVMSAAGVRAYDDQGTALPTAANLAILMNRIGAFTGTGVNTLLGVLKAALSKAATLPSDVGGTFDPSTDSVEALRDRGDSGAWGGGGGGAADWTVDERAQIRHRLGIDGSATPAPSATPSLATAAALAAAASVANAIDAKTTNLPAAPANETTIQAMLATIASYIDSEVVAIKNKTDNLPATPANESTLQATLATIAGYIDTEIGLIKTKTDQLAFTGGNAHVIVKAKDSGVGLSTQEASDVQTRAAVHFTTDTIADRVAGTPPSTPTPDQILSYLYDAIIAKQVLDVNTGKRELYNMSNVLIASGNVTDSGGVSTREKLV